MLLCHDPYKKGMEMGEIKKQHSTRVSGLKSGFVDLWMWRSFQLVYEEIDGRSYGPMQSLAWRMAIMLPSAC